MNGLPYYKAYPRDFIEGTIGMPFEMKAAYRLVLDFIYMQGGALPDDARYISGLLGCSVRKWTALRDALIEAGKIEARDGYLGNYRADIELETLRKFADKQRENGSRPKKNKKIAKPRLNHTEPEPDISIEQPKGCLSSGDDARPAPLDETAEAVAIFNEAAAEAGWPSIRLLSPSRRSALKARLAECGGLPGWRDAIARARGSPLLCGQNERGWTASFDFLTRQSSFAKLMEGNYDPKPGNRSGASDRPGNGPSAALAQIARLAGLGEASGNGGFRA